MTKKDYYYNKYTPGIYAGVLFNKNLGGDDMQYKITQYEDIYKEQIIEFILNIQRNEFGINITREEQSDLEDIPLHYLGRGGQFWVALSEDDKVIGTVGLVKLSSSNAALKKMFVNQNFRNLKLGKKLLNKVIDASKDAHITDIYLGTIDKFISAQHFYRNNGFYEIKKSELPTDFPKIDVDNRFYHRKL